LAQISTDRFAKLFIYATLFNLIVAVAITLPVLVPEFTFPLILTVWPGTWALVAYLDFLILGVLGSLGWGVLFHFTQVKFGKEQLNRYLSEAQFTLTYVSLYGQTTLMFALGYSGGNAILQGFGRGVVTQGLIGWMVVPIGVFTYLYILGTILGIANVLNAIVRAPGGKTGT
jgi:hypothetical protein